MATLGYRRNGGLVSAVIEEMFANVVPVLADDLGKPPLAGKLADHGRCRPTPYRRAFGDWWTALAAADIVE